MNTLIVIVGPTAVGKTALSVQLAQHFKTEVLSADSRQFYMEMNIGTAKPTVGEMHGVRHHFVNHLSIEDDFSVGKYEKEASEQLEQLFEEDKVIVCGGSGLYVKAILEGLDEMPKSIPKVRQKLNEELKLHGLKMLQKELSEVDPIYYSEVDVHNPQRIIRALEVFRNTGKPFSTFRSNKKRHRDFNVIKVGLELPREELYDRINSRVDKMLKLGLKEEVESLFDKRHLNALQTVGYQEIFSFFEGNCDWEEAIRLLKRNTRRYAKRQMTWFKKDEDIKWFSPKQIQEVIDHVDKELKKQV